MHKKYLLALFSAVVIVSLCFADDAPSGGRIFKAVLAACEETPQGKVLSKGEAVFTLNKEEDGLSYRLALEDIEDVTAAHIHIGTSCNNNPPVASLFTGPKKGGKFSGTISEGTITADELIRTLKGKPLKALIQVMTSGEAFVHVHTDKFPAGELRGQIK